MPNAYISGTGFFVPPNVVTNDKLAKDYGIDTTHEWILQRTGIEEHSTRNMPSFVGIRGAHIDNPNLFRITRIGQPLHIGEHFCFRVLVSHVPIIPMT